MNLNRKQYNIKRAFLLKSNILNHQHKVNLPTIDNIHFIENDTINGINFLKSNYNLINTTLDLKSDNLFKGKKKKDVLVKTFKIKVLPNDKQKQLLLSWMDTWIVMYNKVISIIKEERKQQSILSNKPLKYNEMNLGNLKLNKLKNSLNEFTPLKI